MSETVANALGLLVDMATKRSASASAALIPWLVGRNPRSPIPSAVVCPLHG
jgi:hypothetical protein